MPLRYMVRLAAGLGTPDRGKAVLAPSTRPAGVSPSTKLGWEPPHGPEDPSTRTQSAGVPVTDSMAPVGLTNATRPAGYPGALSGRAPRRASSPMMSASCTVSTMGAGDTPTAPAAETLTSRMRSGSRLEGTAQVS